MLFRTNNNAEDECATSYPCSTEHLKKFEKQCGVTNRFIRGETQHVETKSRPDAAYAARHIFSKHAM